MDLLGLMGDFTTEKYRAVLKVIQDKTTASDLKTRKLPVDSYIRTHLLDSKFESTSKHQIEQSKQLIESLRARISTLR